jgi:ABC-2 type transport system ATP-binding protein
MKNIIEINELTKNYGDNPAIKNLSFSIAKGEVVGFLGPNGAGKTTTMKILTGHMAPTEGRVLVSGIDVFEDPVEVKRRIGYLPEIPPLHQEMHVRDYLSYVARLKGVSSRQVKKAVDKVIERVSIKDVQKRLIGNLSKGYQQRVGIAQALVSDPEILVLDEPTVGLDPKQVAEIRQLLKGLSGEHTVILSTHILPEVQAVCERIVIINNGIIVAEDTLAGLNRRLEGSQCVLVKLQDHSEALISELKGIDGVISVDRMQEADPHLEIRIEKGQEIQSKLAERIVQAGCGLLEMKTQVMSLEEIFLKVTTEENSKVDPA